ncbi:MAG: maltose alpha-D-glucosyltransferase / alpha-amylase [Acidobacteriota bacterium]|jgi:maltose alpha-D-glucosyltransferase/alpha-amylase|nr:maltose alpha-D-glucosyltransferase / alpha-amylase [Acidobacteriota bacterium]
MAEDETPEREPLWYKDAILYEIHVRAFADADNDGMGDFKGLTAKLDYLQDLGVTALWILPFYPSPWRDDGYDISDYTEVHPAYGSIKDFKVFLREAHRRGLKVITELVINHTSDQHPWFQRARHAEPGSRWRDFYVWSDSPEKYADARIIFKDFESSNWSWDPVAKAYYWHRFFSHQPDLNFENERVHRAVVQALDFWMDMGVDGMRLDAIPYLYEAEGTNCENLPRTHEYLKTLRAHVDAKYGDRMLLAEANQWPEDSIAYFGDPETGGNECHMSFHFPVMPRLYMALRMEDRFPIVDILQQTPPIPENCQWATFLRNHDELTLEMVTDEDRDYMYRVYASDPRARINLGIRRRLAPLLGKDRRRIELMNALLFSLPGAPVLYYGDEIGMGDNIYLGDRNGVRTPMQWSSDRNAGFSRANPQKLFLPVITDPEYHYEAVNVELQQGNPHSLLWWTRRVIALRKRHKAFSRGTLEILNPHNHRVLAFLRRYEDETLLVVANLSRFAQHVELDLSGFRGATPLELFGRNAFPIVGDQPYSLSLGPHTFYWFVLETEPVPIRLRLGDIASESSETEIPVIAIPGTWESCLEGRCKSELEAALTRLLPTRRWFGAKARTIRNLRITESIPLDQEGGDVDARLILVAVEYTEGEAETYALPLAFAHGERAEQVLRDWRPAALARLQSDSPEGMGLLYDALWDPAFARGLLGAITRRRRFKGNSRELAASPAPTFRDSLGQAGSLEPSILKGEQSNTSVRFGDSFVLKLFRRLEEGINPDLEVGRFLTERTTFRHVPPVAGWLEVRNGREALTLGVLHAFVPNEGDAWTYTLDILGRYFERVMTIGGDHAFAAPPSEPLVELATRDVPVEVQERIGIYLQSAQLLGQRTAEMHIALASRPDEPDFSPEAFSLLYQRSLYQSMRTLTGRTFQLLRQQLGMLPEAARPEAEEVLAAQDRVVERFGALLTGKVPATRIRCHGDYHLGQVLYTGKDFVILDFEGEPARPLSERRMKRSPFRDVAGMLRSFHYAAYASLYEESEEGVVQAAALPALESWALDWERWTSATFLKAYLDRAWGASFVPPSREELSMLIDVYLLEKAVYELAYELNNRPGWVRIPLQGIRQILGKGE